jgi:Protein of unknown function (DUF3131)
MARAATTFPGILLIDGVTRRTSASGLFSFLDPIISQNVPVGIAVKFEQEEWEKPDAAADLMRLFSTMIADYPGLVELVLELPELAILHPYLRMRSASEARNRFRRSLSAATGKEAPAGVPQTIVSRLPSDQTPVMEGLRSAGILNSILLPQAGTQPEIWRNSDGTQQINGGWRLPQSPTSEEIVATFSKATSREGPVVFAAGFPDDPLANDADLFDQGAVLGDAFRQNLVSSRNYLILPSDLRFRSGEVFSRHLVLCIQSDETEASTSSLGARLATAGVPFTEVRSSFDGGRGATEGASLETGEDKPHSCFQVSGTDDAKWQQARHLAFGGITQEAKRSTVSSAVCAALGDGSESFASAGKLAGFDLVLSSSKDGERFQGFDDHGALRVSISLMLGGPHSGLSARSLEKQIGESGSPSEDVVLLVDEKGFGNPVDATALVQALVELGKSNQFNILSLQQYLAAVSVKSEQARLLRVAQRWPSRPDANQVKSEERDLLIEDARLAWSYIEQLTDPETGLVPATAWLEDGKVQSYQFSTMWDTGSLILGILSAHSIGLLSDDRFSERIDAVLGGLATGIFNGLRLPKGLASTNGKAPGDDDYNASDTARLLVSLYLLKNYAKKDLGIVGILDGWELKKTIQNGVPLTVSGGRLVSSYRSNYAGYIARAFGLWGYPVTSPYSVPKPGSAFDRGVHVLHDVAEFGPIGTEPHLLEAVELGASDLASAASKALFAAQVEEYLSTGKLVCVSEGPINREPWFVYQGFQIGKDEAPWTFETLDPSPRFQTKGFVRAVDMLNSKAAFLWNVYRPSEYSDLLIAQVREWAKGSSLGFSPGVFAVTGKPEQAYSDINTNGVILQAIAYRLNGGKPCADWDFNE